MKKQWLFGLIIFGFSSVSFANQYKCAKMIYADGWLVKYEHLGNTWGANTKKHGTLSSTFGSSLEKTTSSVDPGVTTGNYMSSIQYTSSWGECSMLEYHITKKIRKDYIDQNMEDIKKQIALGSGHHIDSLAFLSGCKNIDRSTWLNSLRKNTGKLYDSKSADSFVNELDATITNEKGLVSKCSMPESVS